MSRNRCIGIVREVYNKWERRTPLTPAHVQRLVQKGIRVLVEPSDRRVYKDSEYASAGAELTADLSQASVVFGVKQVPIEKLLPERTYVFFSHTIKGQASNMPMLEKILERNIRLIDYEVITETGKRNGPRMIAFGGWAGRAGMINTLRAVGERMLALGSSTSFLNVGSSYMYPTLDAAKEAVSRVGDSITKHGIPSQYAPMTFIFTGNGNVSRGAQEVFDLLPHQMVAPEELANLPNDPNRVYGCVVKEEHMVKRRDGGEFALQEYYNHPERYDGVFHTDVLPHASTIVNCTYWDDRYPRLVTLDQYDALRAQGNNKLQVVSDISCDIGGSIEFLLQDTHIEQPFFRYDPTTRTADKCLDGDGVLMMGVDILPSELPKESSTFFGDKLMDFVEDLVVSDLSKGGSDLPTCLQGAIITSEGKLTEEFSYIAKMRDESARKSKLEMQVTAGSTVLNVVGNLFDTNLINQILNLIEERSGSFHVVKCMVRPNLPPLENSSEVHIQLSVPGGRPGLDKVIEEITKLVSVVPGADGSVEELPSSYCSGDFKATLSSETMAAAPAVEKDAASQQNFQEREKKEILILGSGLVAEPCVEYLARNSDVNVTVASALPEEAGELVLRVGRGHNNVRAITLDAVKDAEEMVRTIQNSDLVVSLLPATMHIPVAEACIEHKVPLCNASYVSPGMKALHEKAQAAGVPILCEMGLDPGMDHMSAMKVIEEVQDEGGKITSFSSVCGGLPAPEAANNPLAYKFSWSPRGVLSAAANPSKYLKDAQVVEVKGEDLLKTAEPVYFLPSMALECLPNRDAMPYAGIYNIEGASSVFRGTLRYQGWSDIMYGFRLLGLLDTATLKIEVNSWAELMASLYPSEQAALQKLEEDLSVEASKRTMACLHWLGVYGNTPIASEKTTLVDAFCELLQEKLPFKTGERDMALMHHEFDVEFPGRGTQRRTSTFLAYGSEQGDTIMAKTVGVTVGIGAQLLLDERIKRTGVLVPTTRDIYGPGLDMLEKEGITFVEECTELK